MEVGLSLLAQDPMPVKFWNKSFFHVHETGARIELPVAKLLEDCFAVLLSPCFDTLMVREELELVSSEDDELEDFVATMVEDIYAHTRNQGESSMEDFVATMRIHEIKNSTTM